MVKYLRKELSGVVVLQLSLLHNFIQQSLNSGSAHVQILLRACLEIQDGEDLWQWSQLEIRVKVFYQSSLSCLCVIVTDSAFKLGKNYYPDISKGMQIQNRIEKDKIINYWWPGKFWYRWLSGRRYWRKYSE